MATDKQLNNAAIMLRKWDDAGTVEEMLRAMAKGRDAHRMQAEAWARHYMVKGIPFEVAIWTAQAEQDTIQRDDFIAAADALANRSK
jgi:hypothetical protein